MSGTLHIPAHEIGVVRIFKIDLPDQDARDFGQHEINDRLWEALGTVSLNAAGIEIFPVGDLDDIGLTGYILDGLGVSADQVEPMRGQLEAITGHVLVLLSSAFSGQPSTLTPQVPLRHIATFHEEKPPVRFEPLPDESAAKQPVTARKPPSDAAMSGRVATVALLFLGLFVTLLVWMSG